MTWLEALLLIGAGLTASFINTVAGGGSLITVPLLIFMGLPSAEANASNRVAIILQNISAIQGFKSKGYRPTLFGVWLAISASVGAILGAQIAVEIGDKTFNRILAVVMIGVLLITLFNPLKGKVADQQILTPQKKALSIGLFFLIGIYGGFIQAGVGFLIIACLSLIHGFGMARINSFKVFVILIYTLLAVAVFIWNDKVLWEYGIVLGIGNAIGAYFTSRWSVNVPDRIIRVILTVAVSSLAVKLWFFG